MSNRLLLMLNAIRLEIRAGHLVDIISAYPAHIDESGFHESVGKLEELHTRSDRGAAKALGLEDDS